MREILQDMNLKFKEAGSQQPYDFRIEISKNETLLLELKKTGSFIVYLNDTLPKYDTYYIIIYTGKIFKTKNKKEILPQILSLNGKEIVDSSKEWVYEFQRELENIKQKYKNKSGFISVYPRPTYKFNIEHLINR